MNAGASNACHSRVGREARSGKQARCEKKKRKNREMKLFEMVWRVGESANGDGWAGKRISMQRETRTEGARASKAAKRKEPEKARGKVDGGPTNDIRRRPRFGRVALLAFPLQPATCNLQLGHTLPYPYYGVRSTE